MTDQAARAHQTFTRLQDGICSGLEALDGGGGFVEDAWSRPGGGGGRSRTIEGALIEKGGVGFSAVHGSLSPAAAAALKSTAGNFFATGVSIVLHPRNPWMPIIHMNVRYFELDGGRWWFGGGIDLTPHYVDPEMARTFHLGLREVCRQHPTCAEYELFKAQADEYFYLPHRKETRGVGGIFYDRLQAPDFDTLLAFSRSLGEHFVPAYASQAERLRDHPFDESHEKWQALRRGRYVEFNLAWDRGTKFGLETDGRTESILMSMPPLARWIYDYRVPEQSPEGQTLRLLRRGHDWIG